MWKLFEYGGRISALAEGDRVDALVEGKVLYFFCSGHRLFERIVCVVGGRGGDSMGSSSSARELES